MNWGECWAAARECSAQVISDRQDMPARLGDDLQPAFDSTLPTPAIGVVLEFGTGRHTLDSTDRVDRPDAEGCFAACQNTRNACASIAGRSMGCRLARVMISVF